MESYRLLAIDDDRDILRTNQKYLEARNYRVDTAADGSSALDLLRGNQYDCILLDVLLPDLDGFALCEAVRKLTTAPILFLSCMDDEEDKIRGLMAGGDDYITKPYSMRELCARIHVQIRRNVMKGFVIDHQGRGLTVDGRHIPLTHKEFDLFLFLMENADAVFSSAELYNAVWRTGFPDTANTVAVHVARLRRKLKETGGIAGTIETIRGEGYRWKPGMRTRL